MSLMKKTDRIILLLIVAAAAVVYAIGLTAGVPLQQKPSRPAEMLPNSAAKQSTAVVDANQPTAAPSAPAPTLAPADCYLLVTIGDVVFEPYPLLHEAELPIQQADGKTNTLHLTPTGFSMASANCDNQECVHQGEVTLANRDFRLLGNQVICLPNQVTLALLNRQEAAIVWGNAHE